jgi:hypothetical protein
VDVDLMNAGRESLREAMERDDRIEGWQRAVRGTCGACGGDIAVAVSTELPAIPLKVHPYCQCVTEPVVAPRQLKDLYTAQRLPGQHPHGDGVVAQGVFTEADALGMNGYYGTGASFDLNAWLRGSLTKFKEKPTDESWWGFNPETGEELRSLAMLRDLLDDAIEHSGRIGGPVRVHRSLGDDPSALGLARGKVVTDKGFGSTTTRQSWAENFGNTDLDLTIHPDVKAIWGGNPVEAELLLQRNCRYVIESVEKVKDRWKVKATVLPPG